MLAIVQQDPPKKEGDFYLAAGQVYEGFVVLRHIGRGGFGEVYLVKDADGKRGALKLFVPVDKNDRKSAHRFLMEAQILKRMRPHTHLVRCDGHGQANDEKKTLWILLEFLPGNTLRRELEISEAGRMPLERVLRVGLQVAIALAHCHAHGLVHRDVKPENVMITPGDLAKLLDFGIAKAQGVHLRTTRNVQLGTGLYMAPDRLIHQGEDASALWDMYSLGVVMWELATGHHPFHSRAGEALTDAEVIHMHMGHKIPSLAEETGYPEEICAVIMRACSGNPRARFASMNELVSALEKALRTWRDMSTEKVPVLGANVSSAARARIVQATTEPSIAFAVPEAVEAPASAPAPSAPAPSSPRWLRTEPMVVETAASGVEPVRVVTTAPLAGPQGAPVAALEGPQVTPAVPARGASGPASSFTSTGTARLSVPEPANDATPGSERPRSARSAGDVVAPPLPAAWGPPRPAWGSPRAVPIVPSSPVLAPAASASPLLAPAASASPLLASAASASPLLAPVPSPRVLREIGRPPRTTEEDEIVADLDPDEQRWRILFLRYIDTLPPNAMIDSDATGRAISEYLRPVRSQSEGAGLGARDQERAPLSRDARRVPGWVLVLLGVLAGAALAVVGMWQIFRSTMAPSRPEPSAPVSAPILISASVDPIEPTLPTATATAATATATAATATATAATATATARAPGTAGKAKAPAPKPGKSPRYNEIYTEP